MEIKLTKYEKATTKVDTHYFQQLLRYDKELINKIKINKINKHIPILIYAKCKNKIKITNYYKLHKLNKIGTVDRTL